MITNNTDGFLDDPILGKIRNRLHKQNKNWIVCISGETGSGKSYSALSLAYSIVGEKNKVYTIFNPLDFFKLLDSDTLKRGDVVVCDEFGVAMSAREWQSIQNKLMGVILQTFRSRNLAVIFTVPNLSFIDVQARKLLHCYMRTVNIDYADSTAKLSIYDIDVSDRYDKIYYKHPRVIDNNGRMTVITHYCVSKPSDNVIEEYEAKKDIFNKELQHKAVVDLTSQLTISKSIEPKEIDLNKLADDILVKGDKYLKNVRGKFIPNKDLIQYDFKLNETKARAVRDIIRNTLAFRLNKLSENSI